MVRIFRSISLIVISLLIMVVSLVPQPVYGQSPTPGSTGDQSAPAGKIAYVTQREVGDHSVTPAMYVVDAKGGNRKLLVTKEKEYVSYQQPAWSPDGSWIAFVWYTYGNYDIYVMDSAGKNLRRLTNDPAEDRNPTWSADGKYIAFSSKRGDFRDIYVMDSSGKNVRHVTNNDADNEHPTWSPDGKQLAYASNPEGHWEIYTANVDGSNEKRLTTAEGKVRSNKEPAWSPDGKSIAFTSERPASDIYVMDANGENVHVVTDSVGFNTQPCWSPDSKYIAFQGFRGSSGGDIYVVSLDDLSMTQLTKGTMPSTDPTWVK